MMRIGHVRMSMRRGFVAMPVSVRSRHDRIMNVHVMPVVMHVRMIMFGRFVDVVM